MFASLFSKKNADQISVVFDIGSSSIGGSIVKFSSTEKPKIIYTTRKPIEFQKDFDFDKFFASMTRSLFETADDVVKAISHSVYSVAEEIEKKGKRHLFFTGYATQRIRNIYCVFSSPWHTPETREIHYKKSENFILTEKLLLEIINEKKEEILRKYQEKYPDREETSVKIMEGKVVDLKVNGYNVEDPYQKEVREIRTTLFLSIISNQTLEIVKEAIGRVFNHRKIHFTSFTLSFFAVVRDLFPDMNNFLLIDVNGEVTEIIMVRNSVIERTVSFPYGKNDLVREVTDRLNTFPTEALSLLKVHIAGKSGGDVKAKLDHVLDDCRLQWNEKMVEAMNELSLIDLLPRDIFLTSDNGTGQWFKGILDTIFEDRQKNDFFSVKILDGIELNKACDFSKEVKKDTFLTLETLFLDKIFNLETE